MYLNPGSPQRALLWPRPYSARWRDYIADLIRLTGAAAPAVGLDRGPSRDELHSLVSEARHYINKHDVTSITSLTVHVYWVEHQVKFTNPDMEHQRRGRGSYKCFSGNVPPLTVEPGEVLIFNDPNPSGPLLIQPPITRMSLAKFHRKYGRNHPDD